MPPLLDPRHEIFVHHMLGGANQIDSYEAAGFTRNTGNAGRLFRRVDVQARLAELKGEAAEKAIMSLAEIVTQLGHDRTFAREKEAPAAAVTATMGQAKVLGYLRDRVEHTGADGAPLIETQSPEEIARRVAFLLAKGSKKSA
jgi:hypothetical protein